MRPIDDIWPEENFYFRSDHYNFAKKGVPILFFFNGTHADYHQVGDSPDKIDAEKESRIAKLIFYLGVDVANAAERPKWNPESYRRIVSDNYLSEMRVLIVEDDPELAGLLRDGLREHRIDPTLAAGFVEGRDQALAGDYDVVILDVRLPGGTGYELCADLRRQNVGVPVLMLTALDAVDDRVRGLAAGADDYLTKPFAFRELVARLQALTRRRALALTPTTLRVADLDVDLGSRQVRRAGRPIDLTAKEFALLELLLRRQDQVVDRSAITAHVWDNNHDPFANVLDVLVRRLRSKIDDGFDPKLIHTIRGAGYRLSAAG
jgi:two-component system copper resistance phosphate regulon response regulator CusR